MVRVALIVVAIAAGAFVLNLFLFDAADSTGSAGRLSPRADDLPARVLSTTHRKRRRHDRPRRRPRAAGGDHHEPGHHDLVRRRHDDLRRPRIRPLLGRRLRERRRRWQRPGAGSRVRRLIERVGAIAAAASPG